MDDYHAIVVPGGQINPDLLRTKPEAVQLMKNFTAADKIVAAICHGPWLLIEADVVRGREMTSYPSIRTDLKNAGANVVDKKVATDQGIVTSRKPDDLDAFVAKIIEEVREGKHPRQAACFTPKGCGGPPPHHFLIVERSRRSGSPGATAIAKCTAIQQLSRNCRVGMVIKAP